MDLSGKRALVTGASRGLGAAIAGRLAACGADVVVHYCTNEVGARATGSVVEAEGRRALLVQGDLRCLDAAERMLQVVAEQWNGIDLIANNAGAAPVSHWDSVDSAVWQETLALDLSGPFYVMKAALPLLKQASGGAAVVNVGSVASFNGGAFGPAYAAAKAGLIGLTRSAARDWGPLHIRVNCVAPGPLDSTLARALPPAALTFMADQTPLKRLGTFAEVADAVAWLLSPASTYVTGQTLIVDGGRVMN